MLTLDLRFERHRLLREKDVEAINEVIEGSISLLTTSKQRFHIACCAGPEIMLEFSSRKTGDHMWEFALRKDLTSESHRRDCAKGEDFSLLMASRNKLDLGDLIKSKERAIASYQ